MTNTSQPNPPVQAAPRPVNGRPAPTPSVFTECPVLKKMLDSETAFDHKGDQIKLHSHLSPQHVQALYETVLREKPAVVVEIGMSCGTSALAILAALHKLGGSGRLISIDPNQTEWGAVGVTSVVQAGLSHLHQLVEAPDFLALPKLLEQDTRVNLAYIDGWHTFDYTLLDFFYIDKMMNPRGVVVFNDCGWPAVFKVLRFMMRNRKYVEIDVGLAKRYAMKQDILGVLRGGSRHLRLRMHQDRYFRKLENWEPNWNFYSEF